MIHAALSNYDMHKCSRAGKPLNIFLPSWLPGGQHNHSSDGEAHFPYSQPGSLYSLRRKVTHSATHKKRKRKKKGTILIDSMLH